jgi:hypothetical protein
VTPGGASTRLPCAPLYSEQYKLLASQAPSLPCASARQPCYSLATALLHPCMPCTCTRIMPLEACALASTSPICPVGAPTTHLLAPIRPPRRHCWTNITRNWPICVSDEHELATLLASYGLDRQTDCMGVATWTDWHVSGWHPQHFTARNMSTKLVARMRAAPKSESRLGQLLGLLQGQGFVQYSACDTAAALGSARALLGDGAPDAGHKEGPGHGASDSPLAAGQQGGEVHISSKEEHGDVTAHSQAGQHADEAVRAQARGQAAVPRAQSRAKRLLAAAGLSARQAPAGASHVITLQRAAASSSDSAFSRQQPYPERLAAWARQALGYEALGSHCSLLGRKFPGSEVPAALQMALSCAGIGIGSWCEHNQPLPAAASAGAAGQ